MFIAFQSIGSFSFSQVFSFERTYGSTQKDVVNAVIQTADGGFAFAGESKGYSNGNYDVVIAKVNNLGDTSWVKVHGASSNDKGFSITETLLGNYAIAGYSSNYGWDYHLLYTDSAGGDIWNKKTGLWGNDYAYDVVTCFDGGLASVGYYEDTVSTKDIWVQRHSINGDTVWTKRFGSTLIDAGTSIVQTADSGFVLLGSTETTPFISDIYILRLDKLGNLLWSKTYGGPNNDWGKEIITTNDSGYAIIGYTYSYGAGNYDAYLLKLDSNGDSLWAKTFGGVDYETAKGIRQTNDGGYIVVGSTESFGSGKSDVWLFKTDASGVLQWQKTYGGADYELGNSIDLCDDYGYIIGGMTASSGAGKEDFYLIKTDMNGCINSTNPVTISSSVCATGSTGSVQVGVSGGVPPYNYSWSTGVTTPNQSNLSLGIHSLTVTDDSSCVDILFVTVTNVPTISSTYTINDATCFGGQNGGASANSNGGSSPYTYEWDNGETGNTATALSSGINLLTITDGNGCAVTDTVIINSPPQIQAATTSQNATCNQSDGEASVSPFVGNPPFTYLWSSGDSTAVVTNLASGTYVVTVTDSTNCSNNFTVNISNIGAPVITDSVNNVSCFGASDGSIYVGISGGIPVSIGNLGPGNYIITVTDSNGCSEIVPLDVTQPDSLIVVADTVMPSTGSSADGQINVTLSGGTPPYSFAWSSGETTQNLDSLNPGLYSLTVTDSNGCNQIISVQLDAILNVYNFSVAQQGFVLYPNPFNRDINLLFDTTLNTPVVCAIYNTLGSLMVQTIVNQPKTKVNLKTEHIPNGTYILKVLVNNKVYTKKIVKSN